MLIIRDQLAEQEPQLSVTAREILAVSDRRLLKQAAAFYAELSRFVDLAQCRQNERIQPDRWWWHLDVLAELPTGAVVSVEKPVMLA